MPLLRHRAAASAVTLGRLSYTNSTTADRHRPLLDPQTVRADLAVQDAADGVGLGGDRSEGLGDAGDLGRVQPQPPDRRRRQVGGSGEIPRIRGQNGLGPLVEQVRRPADGGVAAGAGRPHQVERGDPLRRRRGRRRGGRGRARAGARPEGSSGAAGFFSDDSLDSRAGGGDTAHAVAATVRRRPHGRERSRHDRSLMGRAMCPVGRWESAAPDAIVTFAPREGATPVRSRSNPRPLGRRCVGRPANCRYHATGSSRGAAGNQCRQRRPASATRFGRPHGFTRAAVRPRPSPSPR